MKKKKVKKLLATAVLTAVMLLAGCGQTETAGVAESQTAAAETEVASAETESGTETADAGTAESTEGTVEGTVEETAEGGLLAEIRERGSLIVGTASGYPPYEFVDVTSPTQEVIGIDIALAQEIADALGVELEVQDMTFTSVISSITAGNVDMAIAGISITEERAETMDFSNPYLDAPQRILILAENADVYNTLESFAGQSIAAEKSTTQEQVAQELLSDSPLVALEKVPDCLMEMQNGRVAGVVVESIVGEQYVYAYDDIVFSDADLGRSKTSAVAMAKGNEDLMEIVNEVIAENQENGNFDRWVEEYSQKAAENAGG